ncbi:hypothetical protein KHP62_00420 [Rhodobacteraceae bacterium NNCM2]|nr:hypothetical protein [Coraliihabitans acroporae]
MGRVFGVIYAIAATTLAGSAIVVVLVAGMVTFGAIIWAALAGFAAAVPVSWLVAQRIAGK